MKLLITVLCFPAMHFTRKRKLARHLVGSALMDWNSENALHFWPFFPFFDTQPLTYLYDSNLIFGYRTTPKSTSQNLKPTISLKQLKQQREKPERLTKRKIQISNSNEQVTTAMIVTTHQREFQEVNFGLERDTGSGWTRVNPKPVEMPLDFSSESKTWWLVTRNRFSLPLWEWLVLDLLVSASS